MAKIVASAWMRVLVIVVLAYVAVWVVSPIGDLVVRAAIVLAAVGAWMFFIGPLHGRT